MIHDSGRKAFARVVVFYDLIVVLNVTSCFCMFSTMNGTYGWCSVLIIDFEVELYGLCSVLII